MPTTKPHPARNPQVGPSRSRPYTYVPPDTGYWAASCADDVALAQAITAARPSPRSRPEPAAAAAGVNAANTPAPIIDAETHGHCVREAEPPGEGGTVRHMRAVGRCWGFLGNHPPIVPARPDKRPKAPPTTVGRRSERGGRACRLCPKGVGGGWQGATKRMEATAEGVDRG